MEIKKVTQLLLFFLRSFGLWPSESSGILYTIYGIVYVNLILFIFTAFIIINIFNLSDIRELIESIYMCFINVALSIKVIGILLQNSELQTMLEKIQNFKIVDDDEHALIAKRMKYFMKVLLMYYISCNLALIAIDLGVLAAKEPELIWKAWYPLDWEHNRLHFWVVYAYQSIGTQLSCNMNVTVDLFADFFMCMISLLLEILAKRMRTIGHTRIQAFVGERKQVMSSTTRLCDGDRILIDSIKMHEQICM